MLNSLILNNARLAVEQWLVQRTFHTNQLFSEELRPPFESMTQLLSSSLKPDGRFDDAMLIQKIQASCTHVVSLRHELLSRVQTAEMTQPDGRWIVFIPGWVDFSELATDPGFVDRVDCPAWDLWVAWYGDFRSNSEITGLLLSWVPRLLFDHFDLAVRSSPTGALIWLDALLEQDDRFRTMIDKTGLLDLM